MQQAFLGLVNATMLWSYKISTREELLFGSNILSRGIYNMGQTRPKPSPEINPIKKFNTPSTFLSRQILPTGQTAIPVLKIKYTLFCKM